MRWNTARGEAAYRNVSRKAFAIILGVMIALGFCLLAGAPARAHADGEGFVAGEPQRDGNVAKIGEQEYATLYDAIEAAQDGDTIEMIEDSLDEPGFYFKGIDNMSITLDLSGKRVTEKTDPSIVGGTLTIEDSSENAAGVLECHFNPDNSNPNNSKSRNGVLNLNRANLILESGSLDTSFGLYVMGETATATINGGSVISHENDPAISVQGGTLIVNDGFIKGEDTAIYLKENSSSRLTVNGGEIEGYRGIDSPASSTAEVNGGLIKGEKEGIFAGSSFTITGGTITGTGNDAYGVYVTLYGDVEISGGQIKGSADKSIGFHTDLSGHPQGTINISGGMFSDKAGENSLVEGYEFFDNTDPATMNDYPYFAAKLQLIDIPVGLTLTWTGHDQCGVDRGKGYSLTGQIEREVGNYTAKATLESGYHWKDGTTDVKDIPWKIVPAPIAGAKVTLATKSYTCNAKAKTPKVKAVVLNGKTLSASTDYTVSYKNNVKPGTATVIVTGKGNYKGTAKAAFTIKLAKAKARIATYPSKKKIIASWGVVKGAKSYQLQWRLKGGKWKTASVKATKKAITKLIVGKTYNYRVRAVAGKVKGPWSAVITRTLK